MKRGSMIAGLCLALGTAACGGDGGDEPVDSRLHGVWEQCDDASSTFTFAEDGTFVFDEPAAGGSTGDHVEGSYTTDGAEIVADATDENDVDIRYQLTYYVTESDRLAISAAFPVGEHDGLIGTWRGLLRITVAGEETGADRRLELREDGTGTYTETYFDGEPEQTFEGSWEENEDPEHPEQYLFRIEMGGVTLVMRFDLLDGQALGAASYCRRAS